MCRGAEGGTGILRTSLFSSIEIYTDSLYIVNNYKSAMFEWSGKRWRNRDGRPVANADLWKELIKRERRI